MPKASQHRRGPRTAAIGAGLLAVAVLASGCVRVNSALSVSSSDLVSGTVIIAALPTAEAPKGPPLVVPTTLTDQVGMKPYAADGYVGNVVTFRQLSFSDMTTLATSISNESATYHIAFVRSGDLVTMDGSVDLSQLPATGVDVTLKVAFPGPVTRSDGSQDNDTVSWIMKAGGVTSFTATDEYVLGNGHGWRFWALSLGGGTALVSAFVVLLALLARRRNLRKERAYTAASAG